MAIIKGYKNWVWTWDNATTTIWCHNENGGCECHRWM